MVASELALSPIYKSLWQLAFKMNKTIPLAYYAPEELDLLGFEPVAKHLPPIAYLSGNPKVISQIKQDGLDIRHPLAFPRALIMSRHSLHKYPSKSIVSIGMRHGVYHFKRLTKAVNFNRFDLFLFSSQADLQAAQETGVRGGISIGHPKLDPAFDGSITREDLDIFKKRLNLDVGKRILLFTATWNASGMSAIDQWISYLPILARDYAILVTLHPWISERYRRAISAVEGARLLGQREVLKGMMLSDVCIGDQSSVLAECCALDKPMVTFRTANAPRALPKIDALLEGISYRIKGIEELEPAIKKCLANPDELKTERAQANRLMYEALDGKAGMRAAAAITKLLSSRGMPCS